MTSTPDAALITGLRKAIAQYAKAKLRCGAAGYVWDADAVLHAEEHCDKALQVVNDALAQAAARIEALSRENTEHQSNAEAYERIIGPMTYREVADELASLRAQLDAMGRSLRDEVEVRLAAEERTMKAAAALEPFVKLSDKRDAHYKKRGGDCDRFPGTHPAYDIEARELPLRVWRNARAAFQKDTTHDQG